MSNPLRFAIEERQWNFRFFFLHFNWFQWLSPFSQVFIG